MKKMFETTMVNVGGRTGQSYAPDQSLVLDIADPSLKEEGATNPEQLFAAGYSACFNGALGLAMKNEGVQGESTVAAKVALYSEGAGKFQLGVEIEGHIEGVSLEKAQELLDKAHHICPYSKAVQGNIEVKVTAM